MENNFDKFFKEKLENRQFEMKPEYWEGAEALIEADEKSGSWRRFLVWFGVALVAGLSVFFIWKNDNANQIAEKEKMSNSTFGNVELGNENNEFEISKNNIPNENLIGEENKLSERIENNNSENVKTLGLDKSEKTKSNFSKSKNQENINHNSNDFSKTISISKTGNEFENSINSGEIEIDKADTKTPTIISDGNSSSIQNLANPTLKEEDNKNEEESNPILQEETPAIKKEEKEEIATQPIASTSTILLPFLEMFLANNNKIKKLELEAVCPFTPPRNKFAVGIFGGAVGYPLVENSSETPFIGFKTGFILERNFDIGKAKMALGTELTYHYRSGNFVATKQNEVARYSFGRSVAKAKLTPENLHYLEIPLYLKYQIKRMTFETGASFSYLLGVNGKVIEVDGTIQSGWVPSLGFKKNYVNVLLGFHYRISDNLHFGVRANYTPGGILDNNAVLPEGITVALQESKPFYLTFRVTQYLKFKK